MGHKKTMRNLPIFYQVTETNLENKGSLHKKGTFQANKDNLYLICVIFKEKTALLLHIKRDRVQKPYLIFAQNIA